MSFYLSRNFHFLNQFRDVEKSKSPILLVFWSVYCVTSTGTYPDMHQRMCLVDEPKSNAILGALFLSTSLKQKP